MTYQVLACWGDSRVHEFVHELCLLWQEVIWVFIMQYTFTKLQEASSKGWQNNWSDLKFPSSDYQNFSAFGNKTVQIQPMTNTLASNKCKTHSIIATAIV